MSGRADDWAELCAPISVPAWEAVAAATAIGDGTRVLDLGCGTGEFCRLVSARGGVASGIDASEEMVAFARGAVRGADLRVGDLEQLPWDDGAFDVVTGFNALQFAADRRRAVGEARRVVRPGGSVAFCGWRGPEHSQLLAVTRPLTTPDESRSPVEPRRRDESRRPAAPTLGDPGVLEALLVEAGLRPVAAAEVAAPFELRDLDTLVRALVATGAAAAAIERDGRPAVRATVAATAAPFRRADGSYRFENAFRYVVAQA